MVRNRKATGTASSMGAGLAVAGLISIAITVVGAVIAANLVLKGAIPEGGVGYCSMVILLTASAAGAVTAASRIKHRILLVSLLSGLIYYVLLLASTLFFFGGQFQGIWATALMVLCGCGTVALLSGRGERGRGKRRKIGRH